jgi:cell division protein FtsB
MKAIVRSKGRVFFALSLAVALYFGYTALSGAVQNHRLAEDRRDAQYELQKLEASKAYLEGVKQYTASDAYVEQEARRNLGYVRDGEQPFVVESPALPPENTASPDWWERLFPR